MKNQFTKCEKTLEVHLKKWKNEFTKYVVDM